MRGTISSSVSELYEKKNTVHDSVELRIRPFRSSKNERLCFVAENPNKDGIIVKVSAFKMEEIVNINQRRQITSMFYFVFLLMVCASIILIVIGIVLLSEKKKTQF